MRSKAFFTRQRLIAGLPLVLVSSHVTSVLADEEKRGMPQLDPSTYPSQLFWLAVFFVLFYGFMQFVAMPRLAGILQTRQARISDDLYHATNWSDEAHSLKTELEGSLAKAREQARGMMIEAEDAARRQAEERDGSLNRELQARIAAAEANIAAARQSALGTIEDIATGIVVEALPRIAGVGIGQDEARAAIIPLAAPPPAAQGG